MAWALATDVVGDPDFAPHVDEQTTGVLVGTVGPLFIARPPSRVRTGKEVAFAAAALCGES